MLVNLSERFRIGWKICETFGTGGEGLVTDEVILERVGRFRKILVRFCLVLERFGKVWKISERFGMVWKILVDF